jgi:hypothetical protein
LLCHSVLLSEEDFVKMRERGEEGRGRETQGKRDGRNDHEGALMR